jgi:hypothetical protein
VNRFPVPRKLPPGFDMHDYYWMPTREEHILERLREMKAEWDAQELAYYRRKVAEIGRDVARDLPWLERQNELEAELTAIQTYFRTEREKELAAEDQARREKAKLILKEINTDINRFEKATLDRRGLIRGRRSLVTQHS